MIENNGFLDYFKNIMRDEFYMKKVLELAKIAAEHNEVPVGALLLIDNKIVGMSSNSREESQSPLGHAEAEVIQKVTQELRNWRLENSTLYISMEPCLMCTGLIYAARIGKVVFGCKNPKGGSLEYIENRRKELNLNHSVEIVPGMLESESSQLLKEFFKRKRSKKEV